MSFIAVLLFVSAIISTVLFALGKKQMRDVVVVPLENDKGFPIKQPTGYIQHQGSITMDNKKWNVGGQFLSDRLLFYCTKNKPTYSNGENCTLNPTYLQGTLGTNMNVMITSWVFFGLWLWFFGFPKTKHNKQSKQQIRVQQ